VGLPIVRGVGCIQQCLGLLVAPSGKFLVGQKHQQMGIKTYLRISLGSSYRNSQQARAPDDSRDRPRRRSSALEAAGELRFDRPGPILARRSDRTIIAGGVGRIWICLLAEDNQIPHGAPLSVQIAYFATLLSSSRYVYTLYYEFVIFYGSSR
jgi:hypothetical protein